MAVTAKALAEVRPNMDVLRHKPTRTDGYGDLGDARVGARHVLLSATATMGWSGSARPSTITPSSSWHSAPSGQRG